MRREPRGHDEAGRSDGVGWIGHVPDVDVGTVRALPRKVLAEQDDVVVESADMPGVVDVAMDLIAAGVTEVADLGSVAEVFLGGAAGGDIGGTHPPLDALWCDPGPTALPSCPG